MRKSASETTDAHNQRRISGIVIPKRQSLGGIRQTPGEGRLSRGPPRRQSAPVKVRGGIFQLQQYILTVADIVMFCLTSTFRCGELLEIAKYQIF